MNIVRYALVIASMVLACTVQAFTFKITAWNRPEVGESPLQRVFVCHDLANFSAALNKEQIEYWQAHIKRYRDYLFVLNGAGLQPVEWYRQYNCYCLQAELIEAARVQGAHLFGIECRAQKARAADIGLNALNCTRPAEFALYKQKLLFAGFECPSMKMVAQEFIDTQSAFVHKVHELAQKGVLSEQARNYLLTRLYAMKHDELEQWKAFEGDIVDYMQAHKCCTAEFIIKFNSFDDQLAPMQALLAILEASQPVIVFMETEGARVLEELLRHSGCQYIEQQGMDYHPSTDLIEVPAQIQSNPALISQYVITTSCLKLHPAGTMLAPLSPALLEHLLLTPVVSAQ